MTTSVHSISKNRSDQTRSDSARLCGTLEIRLALLLEKIRGRGGVAERGDVRSAELFYYISGNRTHVSQREEGGKREDRAWSHRASSRHEPPHPLRVASHAAPCGAASEVQSHAHLSAITVRPSVGVTTLRALAAPSMPQARATKAVRTMISEWSSRKRRKGLRRGWSW